MKLLVTGSPGTGKTALARGLAKALGLEAVNEKDFCIRHKIGSFNDENELEIPVKEFEKKANSYLSKLPKSGGVVLEGHVLCEAKLRVDRAILLRVNPELLEMRLEKRDYAPAKIMDNVFVEGIDYCKKHLLRNYPKSKIIEIESRRTPKETLDAVLAALK
jgi:adenylate kinase